MRSLSAMRWRWKLKAFGVLLQRGARCRCELPRDAYAALIEDVKAALEVQS